MTDNVVQFPDRPENVEALRQMVFAVRAAKAINMSREAFVGGAASVWDGVTISDLIEGKGRRVTDPTLIAEVAP